MPRHMWGVAQFSARSGRRNQNIQTQETERGFACLRYGRISQDR